MSREKLVIVENPKMGGEGYCLRWYFPDDEDAFCEGAFVGEGESSTNPEDTAIRQAVTPFLYGGEPKNIYGFVFETQTKANQALKAANLAIKAHAANKPMPEWATMAMANGWKAPKGWTP